MYIFVTVAGDEGPSRVHNLYVQYQDLIQGFQQADNEISRLKQNMVSYACYRDHGWHYRAFGKLKIMNDNITLC